MKKFNFYVTIVLLLFTIIIVSFIFYTAFCNENANSVNANTQNFRTVILDAGHGEPDGGAVAFDETLEKDINLYITLKLKSILQLNGFNVILTRADDNSIHSGDAKTIRQKKISDIRNREKIILNNQNSLFVSIHQNNFSDKSVRGAQVFYSKNHQESPVLAQCIKNSITEIIDSENKREIKKSGTEIYLLYHSPIPSVMVECGFLSNINDLNNLKNDAFQNKMALAIADGIIKYCKG